MICWKSGVGAKFRKRSHNARQPLEMSGKITLCCQIQFWDCTINPRHGLTHDHSSLIITNCYHLLPIQFSKCTINPSQVSNYLLFITIQIYLLLMILGCQVQFPDRTINPSQVICGEASFRPDIFLSDPGLIIVYQPSLPNLTKTTG